MKRINLLLTILAVLIISNLCAQDGILDPTFGTDGLVTTSYIGYIGSMALQPDGKIVVGGRSDNKEFAVARFNPNGTWDNTFGTDGTGRVTTNIGPDEDNIYSIALQPDGKIVVAGYSTSTQTFFKNFALARYDTTGSLDASFGTNGLVITDFASDFGDYQIRSIIIQPDGKIVAAGSFDDGAVGQFALARYNEDGSLDDSFGSDGKVLTNFSPQIDRATSAVLQPDGKIIVGGQTDNISNDDNFALARYHPDGGLDNSFGIDGQMTTDFNGFNDRIRSLALQPDGKIVAAGYSYMGTNSNWDFALARYDDEGFLDESFGVEGILQTAFGPSSDVVLDVALQEDGKIIAAGWTKDNSGDDDFAISRYNSDGSLDEDFGTNGQLTTDFGASGEFMTSVAIQPDGKIVAGGNIRIPGASNYYFALARYLSEIVLGAIDFSIVDNSVLVYPNPVFEDAILKFTLKQKETLSIQLVDIDGKTIKTFMDNQILQIGEHSQTIVLPNGLAIGVYYIVLSTPNGRMSVKIFK